MQIELSKVKPSPKPIRTTWDETKMEELKVSLMEEGQVEPIGVHENGSGYVIVWGHRRTEAARRAGWKAIEAVLVEQDEISNLIQAGVENLAGEDMTIDDKATWAQRLVDAGLTQREISRRSGIHNAVISKWLLFKREKASGVLLQQHSESDEGATKIIEIAQALGDDLEAKKIVAKKVSDDALTQRQTTELARAYKDAKTPELRQAIIDTPIISKDTADDILRRAKFKVATGESVNILDNAERDRQERQERREMEEWDHAVKEFLDMTKMYTAIAEKGAALVRHGKYSPEAARFAARKIDQLIRVLEEYKEQLKGVS